MTPTNMTNGNTIAPNAAPTAPNTPPILTPQLQTVADLWAVVKGKPNYKTEVSTIGLLCCYLNQAPEQIPIDALADLGRFPFKEFLKSRKFKHNSVNCYWCSVGRLLRIAKAKGWSPKSSSNPDLDAKWKEVLDALPYGRYRGPVKYAIKKGKAPEEFTDADLNAWGQEVLNQGRIATYIGHEKNAFRSSIRVSGLTAKFSRMTWNSDKHYGKRLADFPEVLQKHSRELLDWKKAPYAEGRPQRGRHRAATAERLEACLTRFYGVMVNIYKRTDIDTLPKLVTQPNVVAFVKWSLNERKLNGRHLHNMLWLLYAAVRWNPAYKDYDFGWFKAVLSEIPIAPESEGRERKEEKYVPYDMLMGIPIGIREKAKKEKFVGRRLAVSVHDAFLLELLGSLVWRQRNIRECRLGHNIFRAKIPPMAPFALPPWVRDKLKLNPHEEFWQFRFREDEVKTHHQVRSILPRHLVRSLEEYLQHRSALLHGPDPGTLFLNRSGGPLRSDQIRSLVANITLKYTGRRVTPHVFRDIFAYWWLEHHPEDYLTLSKLLWHRNISTTLRVYGARFDESHALCQMEEWLDRRSDQSKYSMKN